MSLPSRTLRGGAALIALPLLAACANPDYHYSQLLGKRYYQTPIDTYAVSIIRVDGTDNTFRPALVEPGKREITVQGPPGGTGGSGRQHTITFDVAPCTRYYFVAVRPNALSNDFTVRVDHQEPVSGCTPPRAT